MAIESVAEHISLQVSPQSPRPVDTLAHDHRCKKFRHFFAAMILKESSVLFENEAIGSPVKALTGSGQLPDTLTRAQAFRLYGRSNVERWIFEGLINPVKQRGNSSKKFIDRLKLEAVARATGRTTQSQSI